MHRFEKEDTILGVDETIEIPLHRIDFSDFLERKRIQQGSIKLSTRKPCTHINQTMGGPLAHRTWAVSAASVVQDLHRAGVVWGSVRPDTFIVKSGDTPFPVLLATDFSRAAISPNAKGEAHRWDALL